MRSYTASTLNIRRVALPGQASCSGLVRLRARRSVITPAAMQTAASIALAHGGEGLFPERERSRHRYVPGAFFIIARRRETADSAGGIREETHLVRHFSSTAGTEPT